MDGPERSQAAVDRVEGRGCVRTEGPSTMNDQALSPIERVLVAALVSAIVKEIRAEESRSSGQPAA
jgi:hypothetical protein